MFLDNAVQSSIAFCSFPNVIVVAVGFDKCDSDFVGTWRACNRFKENSSLFVQTFACLEGPVCENYENKKITIANPNYPIQQTIQQLVDDSMYTLVIKASEYGCVQRCECYVFTRTPTMNAGQLQPLNVVRHALTISESLAFGDGAEEILEGSPNEFCEGESGMPLQIPLGPDDDLCTIQLVHSEDNTSLIVGFKVLVGDEVMSTQRLYESLNLGRLSAAEVEVECLQLSGHLANDNKQINILTCQGSCSVMYPMPCCRVHKDNLGQAPVWIQRRYIRALFSVSPEANDRIIDLLAAFAGEPIVEDAPKRVGEYCFAKSHAKWHQLSAGGRLRMTAADHKRANTMTRSAFTHLFLILELASRMPASCTLPVGT